MNYNSIEMNKVIIILSVVFSTQAFAHNSRMYPEETKNGGSNEFLGNADATKVKILGKAIKNKNTNEIIAYACVGSNPNSLEPECDKLKIIYYDPRSEEFHYIGQTQELYSDEKEEIHRFLKDTKNSFKSSRNKNHSPLIKKLGDSTYWFACRHYRQSVNNAKVGSRIKFEKVFLGLMNLGFQIENFKVGAPIAVHFQNLRNTNGWNWSVESKKVSEKKFSDYIKFFEGYSNSKREYEYREQSTFYGYGCFG